ncbi:MAG: pteridine reductase [Gammaproteobacteria bacterium]|nr:pteridine reductase [Pseudomonadales bacterium]
MTGCPAVLITGAAKRLGAAMALEFHRQGYDLIIHCNDSLQEAGQLAGQLNHRRRNSAMVLQADLTREQEVATLARQAPLAFGRLDVLVNNASAFYPTPFGQVSGHDWDALVDSNLRGAFFLSQSLAGCLSQRQGAIVNLLDIYAEHPLKNYPVYSIAKAGLAAMTRALAVELAPQVRVNGVAPGAILWPEHEQDASAIAAHQAILDKVPLGTTGSPGDIAAAAFFLAARATYMTGEVIRVDGGRRLNL